MFKIIPSIVLPEVSNVIQHRAIGQHHLQADGVGVQGVVPDEVDAAGVGREVAADLAGTLGA